MNPLVAAVNESNPAGCRCGGKACRRCRKRVQIERRQLGTRYKGHAGRVVKSRDGRTFYQVQDDGSLRRVELAQQGGAQ